MAKGSRKEAVENCLQSLKYPPAHTKITSAQDRSIMILRYVNTCAYLLSHLWLFATSWTVAHQASLSVGFSRKNARVGCHPLLQGIFPTQGSNLVLPHCRQILYYLSHHSWGSPRILGWRVCLFSLIQELNWSLLNCRRTLYQLSYPDTTLPKLVA